MKDLPVTPQWADPGSESGGWRMIEAGHVDLWRGDLAVLQEWRTRLEDLVPDEERARYGLASGSQEAGRGRLHRGAIRGLVRLILSRYLPGHPRVLPLVVGALGKPCLPSDYPGPRMQWSLSHTEATFVLAVSASARVGIDLEWKARKTRADSLASRFFTEIEINSILATKHHLKDEVFLHYWMAKEAVAKATGRGLAGSLKHCEVDWEYGTSEAVVRDSVDKGCPRWPVRFFDVYPEYRAALTVEGGACGAGFLTCSPDTIGRWLVDLSR